MMDIMNFTSEKGKVIILGTRGKGNTIKFNQKSEELSTAFSDL